MTCDACVGNGGQRSLVVQLGPARLVTLAHSDVCHVQEVIPTCLNLLLSCSNHACQTKADCFSAPFVTQSLSTAGGLVITKQQTAGSSS